MGQGGRQQQGHGKHVRIIRRETGLESAASYWIRTMPNVLKTAVLLGAMSALLLFLGEMLGGAQGLVVGFGFFERQVEE